ncbi:MAG: class I SAM-dependent methyltransferase [Chthoniobacterales bacterium]|nr:class I SAM-dependent methyltransferase [Chthoniobacterales bacterium]
MQWITAELWERLAHEETDAHRLGTHPRGWVDRYGDWVLETAEEGRASRWEEWREEIGRRFHFAPRGWLVREWTRDARDQQPARVVHGDDPGEITVREDGAAYVVRPGAGYSSGLFLDQRLNRRWVRGLRARRTLNLFAYTCSFSVCSALGGGGTLSVDTSKRALARGRENFSSNAIPAGGEHRFVAEDVMRFVPRLARRREEFDLIILDPPTFGRAEGRVFRLERDLPELVRGCASLLVPGGWMLVACNNARWNAADLRAVCAEALPRDAFSITPGETPPEIPRAAVSWRLRRASQNHRLTPPSRCCPG